MIGFIVTADGVWYCLREEARSLEATPDQLKAIDTLERLVAGRDDSPYGRAVLKVWQTTVGLAVSVEEADPKGGLVINGKWFRLTIEPSGFTSVTCDLQEGTITLDPADYT